MYDNVLYHIAMGSAAMADGSESSRMTREVTVGVVTAIVLGALGLIWNWASEGGAVRLLGGVTLKDVDTLIAEQLNKADLKGAIKGTREISAHQGRLDRPVRLGNCQSVAVIAFDAPGGCPKGWVLEQNAVGSAIVGVGATLVGDNGRRFPGTYWVILIKILPRPRLQRATIQQQKVPTMTTIRTTLSQSAGLCSV